jgi:ribosomal protein S18 acetylase RimI-like enzyme
MDDVRIMKKEDIPKLKEVIEDDNMIYSPNSLERYVDNKSNIAFIIEEDNKIVGLAYCYILERLDEVNPMLYIHSVGILSTYQNKGLGTKLMNYIIGYAKMNNYSECFVITEKSNKRACKVYEKVGGVSEHSDDIVYVVEY